MKKVYVLVESTDLSEQDIEVFGTQEEANSAMRAWFDVALLDNFAEREDKYDCDFAYLTSTSAWACGDVTRSGGTYYWQIWEKEVQL